MGRIFTVYHITLTMGICFHTVHRVCIEMGLFSVSVYMALYTHTNVCDERKRKGTQKKAQTVTVTASPNRSVYCATTILSAALYMAAAQMKSATCELNLAASSFLPKKTTTSSLESLSKYISIVCHS